MMPENELRELHGRLVKVMGYAKRLGVPHRELRELGLAKLQLEWLLEMGTVNGLEWAAAIFRGINNIEGLQRTYERSEEASRQ